MQQGSLDTGFTGFPWPQEHECELRSLVDQQLSLCRGGNVTGVLPGLADRARLTRFLDQAGATAVQAQDTVRKSYLW
jgi:hypothetical protein